MIDATTLDAMTQAERLETLDRLAHMRYGERYGTAIAREFGLGRTTVYRWRNGSAAIPNSILMCLDLMSREGKPPEPDPKTIELNEAGANLILALRRLSKAVEA